MDDLRKYGIPVVLLAIIAAAVIAFYPEKTGKTLTARFPRTISIYEGSDVRVLGVPVGRVDDVSPEGTDVKVTMSYKDDVDLPADVKAVIIAPSIVGDRYVQLTPAYVSGTKLADGATLPSDATAVPLELDQIYSSLDRLTVAIGPDGANKNGALSDLLEVTAANFGGQGAKFHQTIKDFGRLSETLDDNKEELFGSAKKLEAFIKTLADNDDTVKRFNDSLAAVSTMLSGERQELSASLRSLSVGLGRVADFVRTNKTILGKNIKGLNRFARVLVRQRAALEETLTNAPLALGNLALTYNPDTGTLDTNANIGELVNQLGSNPGVVLCTVVNQVDTTGQLCDLIQAQANTGQSGRAAPFGQGGAGRSGVVLQAPTFDPTLGGLVEVS